ncbi:hypothetical protein [Salinivirga cyanobacteriivorans]
MAIKKGIIGIACWSLLILISFNAFSQQQETFRTDSAGFIEDLHDFMEQVKRLEDRGKATVNRIEALWETGRVDDTVKTLMYEVANTLEARRGRPFPHFEGWLNTTAHYLENDEVNENFFAYQNAIINLCKARDTRLRHIKQFIETIRGLKEFNRLSKNGSTIWKSNAKSHTFEFTTDTMLIKFPLNTLTCNAVRDSIRIFNTSGVYDPIERIWYGKSGQTYWERAGYNRDSVFALYENFRIDLRLSKFEVDSAKFYNYYFYEKPLTGKLSDKVTEIPDASRAAFPEFESYESNFLIEGIFKDINYTGGFIMRGAQLYGSGRDNKDARVDIYRDVEYIENGDTLIKRMLFMKGLSDFFVFTDKYILSRNAKVVMILNQDSLYHPGLQFTYLEKDKEVTLLRDDNTPNMSRSPYYDSYHMFEIDAPVVKWKVGSQSVNFTSLQNSAINNAAFLSYNLFNREYYDVFQGHDFTHPFFRIRRYLNNKESRNFTAKEIARIIQQPEHEARKFLLHMTYLGFADYDNTSHRGKMKQKFYDYLLNIAGRKDYDLIKIESTTQGNTQNAVLNLRNFDIFVNGVPQVHISDAKRVNIFPKQEEIILKKNRSIDFAGVIETGYYTFFGNSFHFDYESFGVDLEHIDSLHIKVVDYYDNYGDPVFKPVMSTIENITGNVFIDDPGNKSGIKDNPEYPIFRSTKDSYVYYDAKSIAGGVYTRDTFYFRIDPYEIDSLNSFDAEGMKYTGTFQAGGIFPPIDEELKLKEDNSLGFDHVTADAGLPVYQGKGRYYDSLAMSNEGLKGDGKLEYLTSTSWSDEFKFYPDTMRTLANRFENKKQKAPFESPQISAEQLNVLWEQTEDNMICMTTGDERASMYADQGQLKGTFYVTPAGINGKGHFKLDKGRFRSENYHFLADQTTADVTDFKIEGMEEDLLAFEADSIQTRVDFPSRTASFEALSPLKPMFFPVNKYKAFVNTFEWSIDENALALKGSSVHRFGKGKHILQATPDKRHPRGNLFVSTHPLQYELNYVSPTTEMDLDEHIIASHGVKFIEVADATVYPGDGDFTIKPDAKYKTLANAEIQANNETKYHQFYDATVNITSRKMYSASGYYDYIDKNKTKQQIRFDIISVDSTENTYARGKILGDDDFTLSPAFAYRGDIYLDARQKHLTYDGHFMASKNCQVYDRHWVKFKETLNPDAIQIPVDSVTTDINNNRLYKGIMLEHDSIHILPRFFTRRHHYTNYYISTANGYLQYDEYGKKYEIAQKAKLSDKDTLLNYISANTETCNLYGEGELSFTGDYGQVAFNNFGNINYFHDRNEVIMDLFMTIDFFFTPEGLKYMADTMKNFTGLEPVNMLSERYRRGLKHLVGYKLTDQLLNEQKLFGAYKSFPNELKHTLVISNANFKWVQRDGTFHSFGDIGITSIMDIQVNKKVKGAIQTGTSRTGDYFAIYLELSPSYWFFFKYKRGIMMAVSSDPAFNEIINDLRAGQRRQDVDRGEPKFYYHLGSMRDKNRFLEDFREAEQAPEEPQEAPGEKTPENNSKATQQEEKDENEKED